MAAILHYDPDRTDYSVTEAELQRLGQGNSSLWQNVCIASASGFVTTALNAVTELSRQAAFQPTANLFLNVLVSAICFLSAIAFGIAWRRASRDRRALLVHIRSKPKLILKANSFELEAQNKGG